jgi:hypothetical protein
MNREERMMIRLEDGRVLDEEQSRYRMGGAATNGRGAGSGEKQVPRFARNDKNRNRNDKKRRNDKNEVGMTKKAESQ